MSDRARTVTTGLALAVAVLLSACASTRARPEAGVSVDVWIHDEVQRVLQHDNRIDASTILVQSRDGVVILSGVAASVDEIRRALRLAGRVDGAKQIVNRLRVSPTASEQA